MQAHHPSHSRVEEDFVPLLQESGNINIKHHLVWTDDRLEFYATTLNWIKLNCEFCGQSTENQEAIFSIFILKSEQSLTQMFPNKLLTPALLRLLIPFLCIDILSETNFFFWLLIVGPVGPWLVELSVRRLTHNYFLQQNIFGALSKESRYTRRCPLKKNRKTMSETEGHTVTFAAVLLQFVVSV